jgi:uncharacterized protein GlcG (DUF336 family)
MKPISAMVTVLLPLALLSACGEEDGRGAAPLTEDEVGGAPATAGAACGDLPGADELARWVEAAPDSGEAGGVFSGRREWAAIVDRAGRVCAVVSAVDEPSRRWPASRTIAMAKAFTANGFSTNQSPVSTARLYTLSQPGRPLYGAGAANPFDPGCFDAEDPGVCGGTIVFGGGLPLYRDTIVVGGLGVSGDTPCADHEIAKRIRALAHLMPPGGNFVDDITYAVIDAPSVYTHPLCRNTWRNEQKIGEAPPQPSYGTAAPPVPAGG